jgi:RimJ/RimL family protein N-acetyltransferase
MHRLLLDLPTQLDTDRLSLRPFRPGDGPWYYQVAQQNREHLARYEAENPVRALQSEEQAEILAREFAAAWVSRTSFFFAVFARASNTFVAQIYVGPVSWELPEFELGYFADRAHTGQGYVTEAARAALGFIFARMHARRVRLECDDTNSASIRVAERCGLLLEGHIRENRRQADGSYSGTLHFGMLRREYEVELGAPITQA